MSSPVEPLFGPLTLVGVLILLYIVIRLIHVLIIIGPRPEAPPSMAEIEARRHALGKVLSTLLFWSGLFLLDSLAWLSVLFKETICVSSREEWSRPCSLAVVG